MLLPVLQADPNAGPGPEVSPPPPGGEIKEAPAGNPQTPAKAADGTTTTSTTQAPGGANPPAKKQQESPFGHLIIMLGIFFVIIYFFMWRPQKKQKEERQKLMTGMKKNDKVVTIGGIHGTVQNVKADDDKVVIRVDDNTSMTFSLSAVQTVNPKKAEGQAS